jgi:hypothetical protein
MNRPTYRKWVDQALDQGFARVLRRGRDTVPFSTIQRRVPPALAPAPVAPAPLSEAEKRWKMQRKCINRTSSQAPSSKHRQGTPSPIYSPQRSAQSAESQPHSNQRATRVHSSGVGRNWRFAKTLSQHSTGQGGKRLGFPAQYVYLFVQVDDAGIITDRVMVKCTDIFSDEDSNPKACVLREGAVASTLEVASCSHLPR